MTVKLAPDRFTMLQHLVKDHGVDDESIFEDLIDNPALSMNALHANLHLYWPVALVDGVHQHTWFDHPLVQHLMEWHGYQENDFEDQQSDVPEEMRDEHRVQHDADEYWGTGRPARPHGHPHGGYHNPVATTTVP